MSVRLKKSSCKLELAFKTYFTFSVLEFGPRAESEDLSRGPKYEDFVNNRKMLTNYKPISYENVIFMCLKITFTAFFGSFSLQIALFFSNLVNI